MKKIFQSNYAWAIISIILIVFIVVLSTNIRVQSEDTTGQAYIQKDAMKVVKTSAMTKTYTITKPIAYAYLRDD